MADKSIPAASHTEKGTLDKIYSLLVITERKIGLLENELNTIKQILKRSE